MFQLIFMTCLVVFQDDSTRNKNDLVLASRAQAIIEETENHKKYLDKTLKSKEKQLAAAKKGKINRNSGNSGRSSRVGDRGVLRMEFKSKEARQEVVDELTANVEKLNEDIKSIDNRTTVVFPSLSAIMETGDFGVFFGKKIHILQIIDEKTMRAELRDPRIEVNRNIRVMVKNFSTSGMVDDQTVDCDTVFEVTGTETYQTAVGGTQTVFVLKPLDLKPILELVEKPKK